MSKIIGVTVGTPTSPAKIEQELKPVKTVNGVTPDENGNVDLPMGGSSDVYYVTATVARTDDPAEVSFTIDRTIEEIQEAAYGDLLPVYLRFPYLHANGNTMYCDLALITAHEGSASFSGILTDGENSEIITAYIEGNNDYSKAIRRPVPTDAVSDADGEDGFSPIATVTQTASGATITITDKSGTTTATVTNGKDGADGTATDEQVAAWLDAHPEATTTVEDGSITPAKTTFFEAREVETGFMANLFDISDTTNHGKIASTNTAVGSKLSPTSNGGYNMSPMIPVKKGETYVVQYNTTHTGPHAGDRVYIVDENYIVLTKGVLSGEGKTETASILSAFFPGVVAYSVTPTDDGYLVFGYRVATCSEIMVSVGDTIADYVEYGVTGEVEYTYDFTAETKELIKAVAETVEMDATEIRRKASPIYGQKVCLIGDSNTQYSGEIFKAYFEETYGCNFTPLGYAGATWETANGVNATDNNAVGRVNTLIAGADADTKLCSDYDMVLIMMGTNCSSAGTVDDTSADVSTMCGAIRYCLEKLLYYYRKSKIGVILPIQRNGGGQLTRNELIQQICEEYSIPTLDMHRNGQIVGDSLVPDGTTYYLGDGLHFGANGNIQFQRTVGKWMAYQL